nr:glycosyltransferase [uncultured Butyrivibrio sp.]
MRILYYDWDEFNGEDCRDAMRRLGHQVDTIKVKMEGYDLTSEVEQAFGEMLRSPLVYDLVFSFDFFPNISQVCQKYGVPYVSWVFDCPHYTLDSRYVTNEVNRVFVFDKVLFNNMRKKGIDTVMYSPLGVNELRLSELCQKLDSETDGKLFYEHEVCFLGNLYDNEYNFYDQVDSIPNLLKEYFDKVIWAQEMVFGRDYFTDESIVPSNKIEELLKYVGFEKTGKYDLDYENVLRDILRKKVTVNERHNILAEMGKRFDTVLYTMPGAKEIPGVSNLGIASYTNKMPRVFHRSKINLNISLRSILSGVPLRVMDVLAAGGFLLTSYTPEIEEYFTDGVDLAIARTPQEMIEKAAYYLEHDEERKLIAANGQEKVYECFSYTKLLGNVLDINSKKTK